MNRLFATIAVALLAAGGAGCYSVTYATKSPPNYQSRSVWNHYFLWGLVNHSVVDMRRICPRGVARVQVGHSFANTLVAMLTVGLYSPATTEVWCATGPPPPKPTPARPPPTAPPTPVQPADGYQDEAPSSPGGT